MSIWQGDIRIKTMIELGIQDMIKNPWLIADMLNDTVANKYLKERYGSQIEDCQKWLANNKINVYMSERDDPMDFPAITIEMGPSDEKIDMKHLADLSTEKISLTPNYINKPIPYVVKPVQGSYDPTSGTFTFASDVNLAVVVPNMVLVDPVTGTGYVIQSIVGQNQIALLTGLTIPTLAYGVIPHYQNYESRLGHTFMEESYKIGCHGMDQQTNLWLHSIAVYSLLRYRQALLEADGFAESIIKSSPMHPNQDYSDAGQVIWTREITLSGQVENRWIMQPHRFYEDMVFAQPLKIISNITDTFENLSTVNWSTLAQIAQDGDQ